MRSPKFQWIPSKVVRVPPLRWNIDLPLSRKQRLRVRTLHVDAALWNPPAVAPRTREVVPATQGRAEQPCRGGGQCFSLQVTSFCKLPRVWYAVAEGETATTATKGMQLLASLRFKERS